MLENQALITGFGKMIKCQNQTNPKYSFGKAKRILPDIDSENEKNNFKSHDRNKINSLYDSTGILNRNTGYDSQGNATTDYYYTNPPTQLYKFSKSPCWEFSKSPRSKNIKGKYAYYDIPYNKNNDCEKIKKNWNNHIIGGDIGCDDRMKVIQMDRIPEPGPGRYNPRDIYFKYYGNNSSGYMRPKGNFSLNRKSACNENVSPGSYEIRDKSNLYKFSNSPKFKFGNEERNENKFNSFSIGDRYLQYSAFGEQIMTQKDSRPQFSFGKENRFGKGLF